MKPTLSLLVTCKGLLITMLIYWYVLIFGLHVCYIINIEVYIPVTVLPCIYLSLNYILFFRSCRGWSTSGLCRYKTLMRQFNLSHNQDGCCNIIVTMTKRSMFNVIIWCSTGISLPPTMSASWASKMSNSLQPYTLSYSFPCDLANDFGFLLLLLWYIIYVDWWLWNILELHTAKSVENLVVLRQQLTCDCEKWRTRKVCLAFILLLLLSAEILFGDRTGFVKRLGLVWLCSVQTCVWPTWGGKARGISEYKSNGGA